MCRRIAGGTHWKACGHFQRHGIIAILDCNSPRCKESHFHPKDCRCRERGCTSGWGEEVQKIVGTETEPCLQCQQAATRSRPS